MTITNHTNIPLSVAAWLADDTYDHNSDPYTISATQLIRPLKEIVLNRTLVVDREMDLTALIASKMGTAAHDGIEDTWRNRAGKALQRLGYPEKIWSNIQINPETPSTHPDWIDIYLEKRGSKKLDNGWTISGKFDFVAEGNLEDFKTKKVWAWIFATQDDYQEFILQGSIYRWLHPEIITGDHIAIDYLFTDWKPLEAKNKKDYPSNPIIQKKFKLMSMVEIENWLINRVNLIDKYTGQKQTDIPDCTPVELWQDDPVFKYYRDPTKTLKSTKNFTDLGAANARLASEGKGIVKTFKGLVKKCNYCSAQSVCKQREAIQLAGNLKQL